MEINRVIFLGTPEFAAPSLKMLIDENYELAAVVTQPDRPKGRGGKLASPIVKDIALEAGIRVFQPEKPSEIYDELSALAPDLCITAAYGNILRRKFLRIPHFGTINVHASLLPLYRGPSPIHRALQNGDAETGITTMLTDAGVDTGSTLYCEKIPITEDMYYQELHDKLADLGANVLKKTIPALLSGVVEPVPQDSGLATYAPLVQKSDGELDLSWSAERLINSVRAFGVWPGAIAYIAGRKTRIHKAEKGGLAGARDGIPGSIINVSSHALSVLCGDGGLLNITRLQFDNGRAMDISECWHNIKY